MSALGFEIENEDEWNNRWNVLSRIGMQQLGVVQVMVAEMEGVMRDSRPLVPVVSNTLRSSGVNEPPVISGDEVSIVCGYGGAAKMYALRTHENPRAGKTGGFSPSGKKYYPRPGFSRGYSVVGQWKFLEEPFLARRAQMLERIAEAINRGLAQKGAR